MVDLTDHCLLEGVGGCMAICFMGVLWFVVLGFYTVVLDGMRCMGRVGLTVLSAGAVEVQCSSVPLDT